MAFFQSFSVDLVEGSSNYLSSSSEFFLNKLSMWFWSSFPKSSASWLSLTLIGFITHWIPMCPWLSLLQCLVAVEQSSGIASGVWVEKSCQNANVFDKSSFNSSSLSLDSLCSSLSSGVETLSKALQLRSWSFMLNPLLLLCISLLNSTSVDINVNVTSWNSWIKLKSPVAWTVWVGVWANLSDLVWINWLLGWNCDCRHLNKKLYLFFVKFG